ncbi:MAG: hypothetical protein ACTSXC_08245 [Candidatus Freyarchaeota archaeon]
MTEEIRWGIPTIRTEVEHILHEALSSYPKRINITKLRVEGDKILVEGNFGVIFSPQKYKFKIIMKESNLGLIECEINEISEQK